MVAGNEERVKEMNWETLEARGDGMVTEHLSRLKVDGGYIYRSFISMDGNPTLGLCWVPEIDLSRYQAHLRDAYKQGYEDAREEIKSGLRKNLEL